MRYYTLNQYFRDRFGEKVFKISINTGLTCPNRDGSKGFDGCIYCDNSSFVFTDDVGIVHQVRNGITRLLKKGVKKFAIYFQSYSNTYCSDEYFYAMVEESLIDDRIVAIFVGTRPDVINDNKLKFLSMLSEKYDVFIEYGLQSSKDETLKFVKRGHTVKDFEKAVYLTKSYGLKVVTHLIFGLPYENKNDMINTACYVAKLGIDGVKFHHLHIVKGTALAEMYLNKQLGDFEVLSEQEYIKILAFSLAHLPKNMIILRLVGDAPDNMVIAPKWLTKKSLFIEKLNKFMLEQDLYQGKYYNENHYSDR
ncbi:MAG: TIGR01212 family radical SAM protein [Calditerrivibrio sp.]|nr:TIGR01212 family radical SAM protein [Calditerrivibrio sp.]